MTVTRLPQAFTFSAATSVPVTVADFMAAGHAPALALNFAPGVALDKHLNRFRADKTVARAVNKQHRA